MPQQEPLISIIIPCFNQGAFVTDAIESVRQQTYRHFEIIVVNDGSSDNTEQVVTAHQPSVRYISQRNLGVSAARNQGLRMASGSYVIFLDADDRLLPHALETGLAHFRMHPVCAFVNGCVRHIAHDGSPLATPKGQRHVEAHHYEELLYRNYIWAPATVMFRRCVLESVSGFDPMLRNGEDYNLYLRVARNFPVHCHSTVVAEYRQHAGSVTANRREMNKAALRIVRLELPHIQGNAAYQDAYEAGEDTLLRKCLTDIYYNMFETVTCVAMLLRYHHRALSRCACHAAVTLLHKDIRRPLRRWDAAIHQRLLRFAQFQFGIRVKGLLELSRQRINL